MRLKILVSVGTHPQPFDRLLKELDMLVADGKLKAEIFAQTGNSIFEPMHFPSKRFVSGKQYEDSFSKANIVISHGGAGTIINALKAGKKTIVVPRYEKFGEHTNDHQVDLAKALEKEGKCLAVFDITELENALEKASKFKPKLASNKAQLVKRISDFIGN